MLCQFKWLPLALTVLVFGSPSKAEDLTVAIDLETAPVADLSTIESSYTGSGPTVYAFLVVTGIEGATGLLTGFSVDADSSLVNEGFTCLTPWVGADVETYGFDPVPGTAELSSPVALGYWTLSLTHGSSSTGTLRLVAPGGVNGGAVLILDGARRALPAQIISHAGINATTPDPTEQSSIVNFPALPTYHVIMKVRGPWPLVPPGAIGAPLESVTWSDSTLAAALTKYVPLRIDSVYPTSTPADSVAVTFDGLLVRQPDLWNTMEVTLPRESSVDSLIGDLDSLPSVSYAERDGYLTFAMRPNDPHFLNGDQWYLDNWGQNGGFADADIDAPEAWDVTTGSQDIDVVVLDTGIQIDHNDLRSIETSGVNDPAWHGTMMMGIIGAIAGNGRGVAGLDQHCNLISRSVRTVPEAAQGLYWAANRGGVDIVNMSWWYDGESQTLRDACLYAFNNRICLIAAIGEPDGFGEAVPSYPAFWHTIVTSVGATTRYDYRPNYSNFGPWMDLVAPGHEIVSTAPGNDYDSASSTSASTAVVSGVSALLMGINNRLHDVDVEQILERTADIPGSPPPPQPFYGWGRISAEQAIDYIQEHDMSSWYCNPGFAYQYGSPSGWYTRDFQYPPNGYPPGSYRVRRYEIRYDGVHFGGPYSPPPDVWVHHSGTTGYNFDPEFGIEEFTGGDIVSVTESGFTASTWIFEVRTMDNNPIGFWPVPVEQVVFTWALAPLRGTSVVSGNAASAPDLDIRIEPNPVRANDPTGSIVLSLPRAGTADLELFDVAGRRLRSLYSGALPPGKHSIAWDGLGETCQVLPLGMYFIRAKVGGVGQTAERVIILR